ncbi:MAG: universal stress protein [Bacteroidales bacterium]|jgi:nucleotide-binding universal stress UspA family protein|nr:universal stress protein [Bacteroidales bacterium]MDD4213752.1 universal stress protein [Bacteroidales bacterium]
MEHENKPVILFPYDFTSVSVNAKDFLIELARLFKYSIKILNIFDEGTKEYLRTSHLSKTNLEDKIRFLAQELHEKQGIETSYLLKNVPIKRIRHISEKEHVSFMLMGVNKPKKVSSGVMKVITTSPVPVFVVQSDIKYKTYKKIFFPLDDTDGSRQKATWAVRFAKMTDATIYIYTISPATLRNKEREYRQYRVIEMCERYFVKNRIKFVTETSQGSYKDYTDEALKYAESIESDLFIVMIRPPKISKPISEIDFKLIFNPQKTPILCVNQRDLFLGGGIA